MATKKKTFKIGEACQGGIIEVSITGKVVIIRILNWNDKKEIAKGTAITEDRDARAKIENFVMDYTTPYWASQVADHVNSISPIKPRNHFGWIG